MGRREVVGAVALDLQWLEVHEDSLPWVPLLAAGLNRETRTGGEDDADDLLHLPESQLHTSLIQLYTSLMSARAQRPTSAVSWRPGIRSWPGQPLLC